MVAGFGWWLVVGHLLLLAEQRPDAGVRLSRGSCGGPT
jgi:hypothetical protein